MIERYQSPIAYTTSAWPLNENRLTLLFIHGAGGSSYLWHPLHDALKEQVNTIAIDLPGHGKSQGQGEKTIEAYARHVLDFIDQINCPAPVLCGHSMGGAIVQQLLVDHGDAFKGGILVATGAKLGVMPEIFEWIDHRFEDYLKMIGSLGASEAADPKRLAPLIREAGKCPAATTANDFRACQGFDIRERLTSINLPVCVIFGEDDRLTPPKYGTYLAANIKGARSVQIPRAGHFLPVETPDVLVTAMQDFLRQL